MFPGSYSRLRRTMPGEGDTVRETRRWRWLGDVGPLTAGAVDLREALDV